MSYDVYFLVKLHKLCTHSGFQIPVVNLWLFCQNGRMTHCSVNRTKFTNEILENLDSKQ